MSDKIKAALSKLDPANGNHWTAEGFPRLDTVRLLAADSTLTREAVTGALPGFSRSTANTPAPSQEAPAAAPAPAATEAPVASVAAPAVAPGSLEAACAAIVAQVNENLEADDQQTQVVVVSVDAYGRLKLELQEAQVELEEMREIRDEVARRYATVNAKVDKLIVAVENAAPKGTLTNAVQAYLAQQRQGLEERARRIRATAGVNLRDFLPQKAPIDIRPRKKS